MNEQAQEIQPVVGYAVDGYTLESAISCTASAATDAGERTALVLDAHLKALCELQLRHLERLCDNEYAVLNGFAFNSTE